MKDKKRREYDYSSIVAGDNYSFIATTMVIVVACCDCSIIVAYGNYNNVVAVFVGHGC